MPLPRISDEHQLLDLFLACKPGKNQHRLAFTIVFTDTYSKKLKGKGDKYIPAAYRTVRDLFKDGSSKASKITPLTDIVLVIEEGHKKDKEGNLVLKAEKRIKVLHAHGWVKVRKSFTSEDLEERVRQKTKSQKLDPHRGILVRDYNPQWEFDYLDEYTFDSDYIHTTSSHNGFRFNPAAHPVDTGWIAYMVKNFPRRPTGFEKPDRLFSASNDTRTNAKQLQEHRSKEKTDLVRLLFSEAKDEWRELKIKRIDQNLKRVKKRVPIDNPNQSYGPRNRSPLK